jgi:hypothetical protein
LVEEGGFGIAVCDAHEPDIVDARPSLDGGSRLDAPDVERALLDAYRVELLPQELPVIQPADFPQELPVIPPAAQNWIRFGSPQPPDVLRRLPITKSLVLDSVGVLWRVCIGPLTLVSLADLIGGARGFLFGLLAYLGGIASVKLAERLTLANDRRARVSAEPAASPASSSK